METTKYTFYTYIKDSPVPLLVRDQILAFPDVISLDGSILKLSLIVKDVNGLIL